jgi:nucleoside-diphosphate-sugar epimerase
METILIIGGTGMLGKPVAKRLKSDFNIKLLVRDLEKSRIILGKV